MKPVKTILSAILLALAIHLSHAQGQWTLCCPLPMPNGLIGATFGCELDLTGQAVVPS